MSLRDAILAAKPAQKTVTLKTLKDAHGKPVKVTVRGLSTAEDIEVSKLADKSDNFARGLLALTFAIRDPKTGAAIFTPEDVVQLGELRVDVIVELTQLVNQARSEVQAAAKK